MHPRGEGTAPRLTTCADHRTLFLKEVPREDLKEFLVTIATEARPYGSPSGDLYDSGVAKVQKQRGVEEARKELGAILRVAREDGVHTPIARHGTAEGVFVPMDDYRRYRQLDGDPTDL